MVKVPHLIPELNDIKVMFSSVVKDVKENNEKTQQERVKTANMQVASTKSIKELQELAKREPERSEKLNQSIEKMLAARKDKAEAIKSIKLQEKTLKEQQKISGFSAKRIMKSSLLNDAVNAQKEEIARQTEELEKAGVSAKDNKKLQKEEMKLSKLEIAQARAGGSAEAEDAAKEKLREQKGNTFLGKIS